MNNENQQPLSTQGDTNELQDQLGGTTNLSLDQLKQEGGIVNPAEDNPNRIDNPDDLHEIQADDDLDEPNADDSDLDNTEETAEQAYDGDTATDDNSANDADGNGGYPDEAADAGELNS